MESTAPALTRAWLALVILTLLSLGLGGWLHGNDLLPVVVAAIVWVKAWLVARHFLEIHQAHPFIRRVVLGFIAFTPAALLATSLFGRHIARWAVL